MISVAQLEKTFIRNNSKKEIFSGFNLTIKEGEKVGLFGSNGSGKTTLLNILSKTDDEFRGDVSLPQGRVAYVHQNYEATLLPWFTCKKNILLGREYNNLDIEKGRELISELTKELEINFSLERYPSDLSGGQKQIVTLMRALVLEPRVLLMDEPFASLDVDKRKHVRKILQKHYTEDLTVIICSHRGEEVRDLIDRAIVLGGEPSRSLKDFSLRESGGKDEFYNQVYQIRFKRNE